MTDILDEWARGRELRPLDDEQLDEIVYLMRELSHSSQPRLWAACGVLLGEVVRLKEEVAEMRSQAESVTMGGDGEIIRVMDWCESRRDEE